MDIQLIEVTEAHRDAVLAGPEKLTVLTGLTVPSEWPSYPDIFRRPAKGDWPLFLFASVSEQSIVGNGGFLNEPDDCNRAQIGYEIAPKYRNRGFATDAMKQVLARRPGIHVVAITEQPTGSSASVLMKLGLALSGSIQVPGSSRSYFWSSHASAA